MRFVEGHGDIAFIAGGQGPSSQTRAFVAVENADIVLPRNVAKEPWAGRFQYDGFDMVGIDFDVAKFLGGIRVNDTDQRIRIMRLPSAIYHIEVVCLVCRGIVSDGVSVDGHFGLAERFVRVAVIDSDGRSVAFDNKQFL